MGGRGSNGTLKKPKSESAKEPEIYKGFHVVMHNGAPYVKMDGENGQPDTYARIMGANTHNPYIKAMRTRANLNEVPRLINELNKLKAAGNNKRTR